MVNNIILINMSVKLRMIKYPEMRMNYLIII